MVTSNGLRSFAELVLIVAAALFFAIAIQAFAVKPYVIPTESMLPTLEAGQRVLVDRFSHRKGSAPKLGEITVFMPPSGAELPGGQCGIDGEGPSYQRGPASRRSCSRATPGTGSKAFIKRIVGMPGDSIAIRDGHVIRNGRRARTLRRRLRRRAGVRPRADRHPARALLPHGRQPRQLRRQPLLGPVARNRIVGHAVVTYWPPGRIGGA